ncbi:MAG: hypothetical protein NT062_28840 [Proteobacteria bacterium]|nr:hypothetical protein [Pseudomonadota bacterium]
MKLLIALTVLTGVGGVVHADDFAHVLPKLATAPAEMAAWLSGCEVLVTPRGEVRRPCKLTLGDLVADTKGVTLTPTHVKEVAFPRSTLTWHEADVEARVGAKVVATFHVIEVGASGNPDGPNGGWGVVAQSWTRIASDKDVASMAKAGKLVAPKIADYTQPAPKGLDPQAAGDRDAALTTLRDAWKGTDDLKEVLGGMLDDGGVLVGSAAERLTGKGGGKTVRKWPLGLRPQGGVAVGGNALVQWGVTTVMGTVGGVTIPYVTFVVNIQRMTGGGSFAPSIALVSFGVPQ